MFNCSFALKANVKLSSFFVAQAKGCWLQAMKQSHFVEHFVILELFAEATF